MSKDVIVVVSAVIEDGGRYLLTQRKAEAVLPLLWEFPGGKVEEGESEPDALAREVKHRLGVDVKIGERIGFNVHEYGSYHLHLALYSCQIPLGQFPRPASVNDVRWVASENLENYEFPPADQSTMSILLGVDIAE